MADDPKNPSEESDTIRALRKAHPELAGGETITTPDDLSPADALHSREAVMGIPPNRRGKVMIPDDPDVAAHLPPAEDGFRNEPVWEEGMDKAAYDAYRESIKSTPTPAAPVAPAPVAPAPVAPANVPPAPVAPANVPPPPPPSAQQQVNVPPPRPVAPPPPVNTSENPILTKLKQNLGIVGGETVDVEINDTVFTLRLATARLKSYAASAPSVMNAVGELHWGLYHMYGLCSIYIVAIDRTPLYHVLGEQPTMEEFNAMERTSHLNPPYELVARTTPLFFELLLDELRDGLAVKIVEKYDEAFESHNTLKAFSDVDNQWRYECPKLECEDTYSSAINGTFYCRFHNTEMISQEEAREAKIPLA